MENRCSGENNTGEKLCTDEDKYADCFLNRHGDCGSWIAKRAYELF